MVVRHACMRCMTFASTPRLRPSPIGAENTAGTRATDQAGALSVSVHGLAVTDRHSSSPKERNALTLSTPLGINERYRCFILSMHAYGSSSARAATQRHCGTSRDAVWKGTASRKRSDRLHATDAACIMALVEGERGTKTV